MVILEAEDVCYAYDKGKDVLKHIHLKIEQGSFTALLGANGCGKTTLIQLLCGLIKPGKGQIWLKGINLAKLKDREIYSTIGLVFQNPEDQLFSYTVYEDVAYGVKNQGITGKALSSRVEEALNLLNIEELRDREVHKLSYGQKKRVGMAGVLAMKPEVLILDEPTAGLDPMTSSSLMKTLKKLQGEKGLTVIISTHEVDYVPVNCDFVYVLDKGMITLEGSPGTVFGNKTLLRSSNLRLPRIGHLMEVLKDKDGIEVDTAAMSISGARKAIRELLNRGNKE